MSGLFRRSVSRGKRGAWLVCLFFAWQPCRAFDIGFWTWHRSEHLNSEELTELRSCNAKTVYWHIGEMENRDGSWRWKSAPLTPPESTKELRIVPVIRLTSFVKEPFKEAATDALAGRISEVAPREVQLDMDCPDRLLTGFAETLKKIHGRVPWLSVTALEHWCRHPAWGKLQAGVDEMVPMFYDVQIDPPVAGGVLPLPLVDPVKIEVEIAEWKACRIPWRAGLPLFARLTVYDHTTGLSRGHIRDWNWDDLCFNKALSTAGPTVLGVTLLRADVPATVANTLVKRNDLIGVRWPDREALARVMAAVGKSGAVGEVFFRMPDSTDPSGWSLRQLAHPDATPRLVLRRQQGQSQLELVNIAEADLPPRLSGANGHDRGYALVLEAKGPFFREALEGDFWRVGGEVDAAAGPATVAIPLATRLVFRFSRVRAGQSLRTGLIQLAPGGDFSQFRYRILNIPGGSEWKNIQD